MKKPVSVIAALTTATALFLSITAHAQNIATVNGKPVPKERFDVLMEQVVAQGKQERTPQLEQQVRDEVVMREIFVQEAERIRLQDSTDYKQQIEFARQQLLIRELFFQYNKKNPVTDADIKAEYDKVKKENAGNEYRARHILVENEDQATGIVAQIKGGAKFEDIAQKVSKDAGSAKDGGDLDWARPDSYVPEFAAALRKLAKGEITQTPVKTQYGYHIIKLEDTREQQFPALEQVRPQIEQGLQQRRLATYRDALRAKAKTDHKFGAN